MFNVGDEVRFIVNKQFEQGTLPHWSKTTHSSCQSYKYYELQLVDKTEDLGFPTTEPTATRRFKKKKD